MDSCFGSRCGGHGTWGLRAKWISRRQWAIFFLAPLKVCSWNFEGRSDGLSAVGGGGQRQAIFRVVRCAVRFFAENFPCFALPPTGPAVLSRLAVGFCFCQAVPRRFIPDHLAVAPYEQLGGAVPCDELTGSLRPGDGCLYNYAARAQALAPIRAQVWLTRPFRRGRAAPTRFLAPGCGQALYLVSGCDPSSVPESRRAPLLRLNTPLFCLATSLRRLCLASRQVRARSAVFACG